LHLAQSGERFKAAEHYHTAGKKALKAEHFHLALDNFLNSANLLEPAELETDLGINVTLHLIEVAKPLGERLVHEQALHQLQAIAGHTGREDLELMAMLEECTYLRMISENDRSLKISRELIARANEAGNEEIEAGALKEAGTCCYLTGELEEAEGLFHQAAGILASIGDRPQLARIYNNLGLVCRSTKRQGEMIQFFNRALEIFRDAGDQIGQRFPLGNLGIVYFEQGDYERAFECFQALKVSFGNRTDLMMEAKVDFTLGEIYLEIGLLHKAVSSCESALSTFITIGNRQGESDVLAMLGSIHLAMENIQIAREYFERAIEVKKTIGNKIGILQSQITLARIANLEGRHAEALKLTQDIMKDPHVRKNRSLELECLTEVLVARSQIESAEEALHILGPDEEPDELSHDSKSMIQFAFKVGELAFLAGDEGKALKYIELSGKMVEGILDNISEPEWRDAYRKKCGRIIETYHRLKPAISATVKPDEPQS
jgi:tetratricopeptide (TPR) repeat protein